MKNITKITYTRIRLNRVSEINYFWPWKYDVLLLDVEKLFVMEQNSVSYMRNVLKPSKLGLVIGWGEYTDPYVNSHQRLVLTGTRPYPNNELTIYDMMIVTVTSRRARKLTPGILESELQVVFRGSEHELTFALDSQFRVRV